MLEISRFRVALPLFWCLGSWFGVLVVGVCQVVFGCGAFRVQRDESSMFFWGEPSFFLLRSYLVYVFKAQVDWGRKEF